MLWVRYDFAGGVERWGNLSEATYLEMAEREWNPNPTEHTWHYSELVWGNENREKQVTPTFPTFAGRWLIPQLMTQETQWRQRSCWESRLVWSQETNHLSPTFSLLTYTDPTQSTGEWRIYFCWNQVYQDVPLLKEVLMDKPDLLIN